MSILASDCLNGLFSLFKFELSCITRKMNLEEKSFWRSYFLFSFRFEIKDETFYFICFIFLKF